MQTNSSSLSRSPVDDTETIRTLIPLFAASVRSGGTTGPTLKLLERSVPAHPSLEEELLVDELLTNDYPVGQRWGINE